MSDRMQRFTQRARRVLSLAQEAAERLNHSYIGTEHLLLGLMREEGGVAGRVLHGLGVDIKEVEMLVERKTRSGQRAPFSKIDLSPGTKRVLELAIEEARRLNHHYIGTEQLLLALVSHTQGVAMDVLAGLKITPDQIRKHTNRILQDSPSRTPRPPHAARGYFPRREPASTAQTKSQNFQRFTEHTRRVMSFAEEDAKRHKRSTITTEYLLLGLMRDELGVGGRILRELGLNVKTVEPLVKRKSRAGKHHKSAKLELSPGTQRVIKLSVNIARDMGYSVVDTEYLLLALVGHNEDRAIEILKELKITPDQIWEKARLAMKDSSPGSQRNIGSAYRKRVVVFIEDDPAMIDLVTLILKTKGFEVVGATSGQQGLELIAKRNPDLVLLDLMMPEMDAWKVYQRMKADEGMRAIPLITITTKGQDFTKKLEEYLDKGLKGTNNP